MKNRILAFLLAAVLFLSLCTPALAATAQYATTRAFLQYLDEQDVIYTLEGIDSADYEVVKLKNNGEAFSYDIRYFFADSLDNTAIRVWNIIEYSDSDFAKVLRVCNTLNGKYRYATFEADESDNTVTCAIDVMYREGVVAELLWEATLRLVNILDNGYEALSVYDR